MLSECQKTKWEPLNAFERRADKVRSDPEVALGLFEMLEPRRCDIVETDAAVAASDGVDKPTRPAGTKIWGCLAARSRTPRPTRPSEGPQRYPDPACQTIPRTGTLFADRSVDIGTRKALARIAPGRVQ